MRLVKILTVIFFIGGIFAASPGAGATAKKNTPGDLAVALVIDSSGSMQESDPGKVVLDAAKKAVEMLNENDQVAVVQFDDSARVLVPLQKAGDKREEILTKISVLKFKGDTDVKGGLEKAFAQLEGTGAEKKKFVILLSDGNPDLPQLQNERSRDNYYTQLDEVVNNYRNSGWAVHCLALQEESRQLLDRIAKQTGGECFFVHNASDLTKFFSSIMLVQKYSEVKMPRLFYDYRVKEYKAGPTFPVNKLNIQPRFSARQKILANRYIITALTVTAIILVIIIFIFKVIKTRNASRVKGTLKYREDGEEHSWKELDLSHPGKNEILISSENNSGSDYVIPARHRNFAFKIKKFYSMYYMVFCMPGTFLVHKGVPRSRQQIFHGDRFKAGGITFEFNCPETQDSRQVSKDILQLIDRKMETNLDVNR